MIMKKILLVLCFSVGLYASNDYNCEDTYKKIELLAISDSCEDNREAAILLLSMDKFNCDIIGTDGEYELEVELAKKLKACN